MTETQTLRGVTTGQGTSYPWRAMPRGLGTQSRRNRVQLLTGGVAPVGADVGEAGELSFEVTVLGTSPSNTEALVNTLVAAWAPSYEEEVEELSLVLESVARVYRGRPIGSTIVLDGIRRGSLAAAQLRFEVVDDRWFSSTVKSVGVTVAGSSGGMDTPMDTPMVTTGSGSTGDVTVTNDGTAPAPWTAYLSGPLTSPRLILGGYTILIDGDIAAGSTVVVDSREQTVLVDGASQPWSTPTSTWWEIPPGASTFSFRASAGTGTATLTWRDASY